MAASLTRRTILAGALLPGLGLRRASAAAPAPRVAALDWGLAATVTALRAGPVAVAEMAGYAQWVKAPALPAGTAEIGLRTAPSFEALAALRPDLILVNALNAGMRQRLERIGPTYANAIFVEDGDPVDRAAVAARELGARLGRNEEAATLAAQAEARFGAARDRLVGHVARPVVALSFVDGRHARVYGRGSLPVGVMDRIGLASGWTRPTNAWGFSVVPIEALAACRELDLLVIDPVPAEAREAMQGQGLWRGLLAASGSRVVPLGPIWAFGDLTAAARCADLLADALAPDRAAWPGAPVHD